MGATRYPYCYTTGGRTITGRSSDGLPTYPSRRVSHYRRTAVGRFFGPDPQRCLASSASNFTQKHSAAHHSSSRAGHSQLRFCTPRQRRPSSYAAVFWTVPGTSSITPRFPAANREQIGGCLNTSPENMCFATRRYHRRSAAQRAAASCPAWCDNT
jgi:hypothetical protein